MTTFFGIGLFVSHAVFLIVGWCSSHKAQLSSMAAIASALSPDALALFNQIKLENAQTGTTAKIRAMFRQAFYTRTS